MKLTVIGMLSLATVLACANTSNESAASPSAGNPTQQTTITGATIESRGASQDRSQSETGKATSGVGDKSSVGEPTGGGNPPEPHFGVPTSPHPEPNPPCKPCE